MGKLSNVAVVGQSGFGNDKRLENFYFYWRKLISGKENVRNM